MIKGQCFIPDVCSPKIKDTSYAKAKMSKLWTFCLIIVL